MTTDLWEEICIFLNALLDTEKPILVEGIRDKKALQQLGIRNVILLNKPLYKLVEEISANHKEIIILTDLDKEGRHLYGKLRPQLEANGVKIDEYFREFLFKNTKLRHIEGFPTYFRSQLEALGLDQWEEKIHLY